MDKVKPPALIVDLDGTLAIIEGRDPITEQGRLMEDRVNTLVREVVRKFADDGLRIIILTGREEQWRDLCKQWMDQNEIPYDLLLMRPILDRQSGVSMKETFLVNRIIPEYEPILALDDIGAICRMYREHGVECWQVANDPFMNKKDIDKDTESSGTK